MLGIISNFVNMETVLITGGTGMIGKALTQALIERGFNVIIFTRQSNNKQKTIIPVRLGHPGGDKLSYAAWDVNKQTLDKEAFVKADYLIHLAGASIAEKRWTKKRKQEIISSRVDSSKLIVESLKTIPNKIKTVISATAIGWYGKDRNDGKKFTEDDPSSNDFLGQTCKQWEAAIEPASFLGKRLVKLRIGIVLSNEGAAFVEFKKPLKFGLATILGSGKQIVSWIHIDDLVRAVLFLMENEKMEGLYNAVAPQPASNKEVVLEIARKERSKAFIPVHVPSFALKIVLGEMSVEVLKSTTVNDDKIRNAGFRFVFPSIDAALNDLIKK